MHCLWMHSDGADTHPVYHPLPVPTPNTTYPNQSYPHPHHHCPYTPTSTHPTHPYHPNIKRQPPPTTTYPFHPWCSINLHSRQPINYLLLFYYCTSWLRQAIVISAFTTPTHTPLPHSTTTTHSYYPGVSGHISICTCDYNVMFFQWDLDPWSYFFVWIIAHCLCIHGCLCTTLSLNITLRSHHS